MWFALCEISGEMLADGHEWPLKFNQSRLYKELKCNHSTLTLFLTYCESRSKVHSLYIQPTFSLEIPSLSKYIGKYSEISPNKRKEKEIKEKESKLNSDQEIEAKKILPSITPQEILKKPSPLSVYFSDAPEIQDWLNAGIHETHMMLLKKYSHHEVVELIIKAYAWAIPKQQDAGAWLYTFVSNKTTQAYGAGKSYKSKSRITPGNPTGNPYLDDNGEPREELA